MKNKNIYKPRYKIAFQAKSKIWPYKNSRMRRFFNIRGRKLIRRGYFKRYFLVFNNMKWAIARRYIKPHLKRRHASRGKRYRNAFYTKQQLRHFYGKIKESSFRVFFRNSLISIVRRNNSFFSVLERRLDMIVFRMKILPTIFACNQLVHHYGICVNNKIERSSNKIISVGDSITLPKTHWAPIFFHMIVRAFFKLHGKYILKRRIFKQIRKKVFFLKRLKRFKRKYMSWVRREARFVKYFKNIKQRFEYFYQKILLRSAIYNKHYSIKNLKKILNIYENENSAELEILNKLCNYNYGEHLSEEDFKLELILKKFKEIFIKSINKFRKGLKKRKRFFRKWYWKKTYVHLLKIIGICYNLTSLLNYFWMRISLKEFQMYKYSCFNLLLQKKKEDEGFLVESNITSKMFLKIFNLFKDREYLLKQRYIYLQKNLSKYYFYNMKKRLKKYKATQVIAEWRKHYLVTFLKKRKFKKEKRIPRLRAYHWYIPKYIYFDFQHLAGILISSPLTNEIQYSFRCSLAKIYSFYKSRGY